MKKKLTLVILVSILSSYLLLIFFSSYNIRNMGLKGAEDKAKIAAELVKDGLTAHMVNGIMDNREYFLKKIENSSNIQSLWITRSESVIEQFGAGFNNEIPRDEIDKEVIRTGKPYKQIYETSKSAHLRFTMPYVASKFENPDCMSCHTAKEGDVLGTISMIIDVEDVRSHGLNTSFVIFAFTIFMSLFVFFIIQKSMNPIIELFESITYVMSKAKDGDYSKRVKNVGKDKEYINVTFWINSLLDKLQETLGEIQNTVGEFLSKRDGQDDDILIELKSLVQEIADIHKFKKTIEFDEDKTQIYNRIGVLLKKRFEIDDFVLVESDKNHVNTVYSTFDSSQKISPTCRAFRTKQSVNSEQFFNICENCSKKYKYYICIPYTISDDLELMLHVGTNNIENVEKVKKSREKINDYINEARPEIVSKNLTEILKISSTTDGLTGLFNRKYLDEYIEKSVAQAKRTDSNYGIMMIDIDYFKMVNDTYGHDVGDKVIKALSKVLKNSIREADLAFRFGGEEFLVLLFNCDENKIDEIAQKIRVTFSQKSIQTAAGESFKKTLSIGTAMFPGDADSIWKAIKYADISLYRAKESGRNRVVKFEKEMLDGSNLADEF